MSGSDTLDVFGGVEIDSETVSSRQFLEARVVEEYDVTDHASVTILHDDVKNEHLYLVNEPELDEFERLVRAEVSKKIVDALKYEDATDYSQEEMEQVVRRNARDIIQKYIQPGSRVVHKIRERLPKVEPARVLDEDDIDRILYYITRDFVHYGKITAIMNDPNIEDVSCNAPNAPVFVYHSDYQDTMTNIAYEEQELDSFIRTLAQGAGKHISVADPMVDGSLKDGSRVQLTLGDEVTGDGSNFTIRKFEDIPFTPVDLIDFGTFSLDQMAYLWLAIENNKSLIFAGGTASGKTTSMNAVSLFIPPGSKTITIEDTREIQLRHNTWIKSMTRDSFGGDGEVGEVGMYDLLEAALRQRPEYLVVGEIRGEEAQTLFQAMSTGHTTYSTMHADSIDGAIHRLENPPIDVPRPMLKALDILCVQNQAFIGDERVRRNETVVEITGIDNRTQRINTKEIYEWDASSDTFPQVGDSHILGEIAQQRAWSREELQEHLDMRKEVLQYLLDNNIDEYAVVTDILRAFMMDNDTIMEKIKSGDLEQYATSTLESEDLVEEAAEEAEEYDLDEDGNIIVEDEDEEEDGEPAIDPLPDADEVEDELSGRDDQPSTDADEGLEDSEDSDDTEAAEDETSESGGDDETSG